MIILCSSRKATEDGCTPVEELSEFISVQIVNSKSGNENFFVRRQIADCKLISLIF